MQLTAALQQRMTCRQSMHRGHASTATERSSKDSLPADRSMLCSGWLHVAMAGCVAVCRLIVCNLRRHWLGQAFTASYQVASVPYSSPIQVRHRCAYSLSHRRQHMHRTETNRLTTVTAAVRTTTYESDDASMQHGTQTRVRTRMTLQLDLLNTANNRRNSSSSRR